MAPEKRLFLARRLPPGVSPWHQMGFRAWPARARPDLIGLFRRSRRKTLVELSRRRTAPWSTRSSPMQPRSVQSGVH